MSRATSPGPLLGLAACAAVAALASCDAVLGVEAIRFTEADGGPVGSTSGPGPGPGPAAEACNVDTECPALDDTPVGCSEPRCVEGRCVYQTRDADGDGARSAATCTAPPTNIALGDDCDDADPNISPTRKRPCGQTPDGTVIAFPGGRAQGECRLGEQGCTGALVGPCTGAVVPVAEVCEGSKDENCDGAIDEACPCSGSVTRPCGIQLGVCKGGMQTCSSGAWGDCVGGKSPEARACDGLDHDCNGTVDTEERATVAAEDVGNACLHLFACPGGDRREVCYRSGIGYTYYCSNTRRTLGYARMYSPSGSPNAAPPGGWFRIGNNPTATKVGPFDTASPCCSGGCQAPGTANNGVYLATDQSGTLLYTPWP